MVGKLGCHGSKWWGLKKATIASQQNGIYIVAKYVVETTYWLETWKPTQKAYFGRSKKFQTWPIHRVHANMYSHKRSLYVPSKKNKRSLYANLHLKNSCENNKYKVHVY